LKKSTRPYQNNVRAADQSAEAFPSSARSSSDQSEGGSPLQLI